jgi:phosphoenolpyruvate carboxylase
MFRPARKEIGTRPSFDSNVTFINNSIINYSGITQCKIRDTEKYKRVFMHISDGSMDNKGVGAKLVLRKAIDV